MILKNGLIILNNELVKKDLTFHHIVKKCEGGKEIITNGALLMNTGHQYLHIIEFKDFKTYKHINDIFRIVNDQQYEPTKEQRETLEYILQEFEIKHKNDRNSKGKKLHIQAQKKRDSIVAFTKEFVDSIE